MLVGIGNVDQNAQLVSSGMIELDEIREVKELGAVGEVLGHFFDERGGTVCSSLSARTLSLPLEQLGARRIVAIAGGNEKTCAIRSVLMSGLLDGLITDESTAHALMDDT
jgi:DNA-binding transcriptional regulator LsrR (DeoR family)